jgi:rod shape determining protein RodA
MTSGSAIPERVRVFLARTHWPILLAMVALMALGVGAIRVSELAEGASSRYSTRQAIFAGAGVFVFLMTSSLQYARIGRVAYGLFGATLGLLVLVLFLPPIRHSHRWIDLRVVLVQPSEIAKLTYIILLAWYLRYGDRYRQLRGLVVPFLVTLVPMGLILVEPDLGTCLLLLPTLFIMLFMAGAKTRHLLGVFAIGAALLFLPLPKSLGSGMKPQEVRDRKALAYHWGGEPLTIRLGEGEYAVMAAPLAVMRYHQLRRIEGWLRQNDPEVVRGKGYQLYQSKMILGTGGWAGRGGWSDAEAYFHLLPDDHTDFIFSVIGGQWGFLGCLAVLGLYGALLAFGVAIASGTNDPFGRLLAVGMLALLFSQVCINVGMTVGLMPITGMTLPLVSYGGSSLLVNCAALGLLASVSRYRPISLARKPFEHGERRERASGVAGSGTLRG